MNWLLALGALVGLWLLLHGLLRQPGEAEIVAHRGAAAVAPENTLPAVRIGMESGAKYLEIDVQRSADGALVVIHDGTVDRTTDGSGEVGSLSLQQLKQLDAGGWFGREFNGARIPTLQEVFETLADWPGVLVIEAKNPSAYPGIAGELARAIEDAGFPRIVLLSFDHAWLGRFRQIKPEIPTGELSIMPIPKIGKIEANSLGVNWLAPILDPTLIARTHRRQQRLWVWTVDQAWQQRLMRWLGVDGITANNPRQARSNLN